MLRFNDDSIGDFMAFTITRKMLVAVLSLSPLAFASDQATAHHGDDDDNVPTRHNEATIAQLQAEMASGKLTSEELTREYIARILALDQNGPGVNAVIELNPDALAMARHA